MSRPYLVIPQLIEQPTWGGRYILNLKGWDSLKEYAGMVIGQSYELSGASRLATTITDSADPRFGGMTKSIPSVSVSEVLPPGKTMPLLIKVNQARGNSFQLHIKPDEPSDRWLPKPESWYFLENGYISLGLREGCDVAAYHQACLKIDAAMHTISNKILAGKISLDAGRHEAQTLIQTIDPWQFVNRYHVKKGDLIDLSMGAIHHSWEELGATYPLGNIVFEVQLDSSDDQATIRAFDQGKIKNDGTIRTLAIDEYFSHLDTDPVHNSLAYLQRVQEGEQLMRTRFYSVDLMDVSEEKTIEMKHSFHHLYVRSGAIIVNGGNISVRVSQGHSCMIPGILSQYGVAPGKPDSVVIKTFL